MRHNRLALEEPIFYMVVHINLQNNEYKTGCFTPPRCSSSAFSTLSERHVDLIQVALFLHISLLCHVTPRNRSFPLFCLQVAYLGPSRRLLEGCDKNWGVRAADDIPVGTFVCTVAGQV